MGFLTFVFVAAVCYGAYLLYKYNRAAVDKKVEEVKQEVYQEVEKYTDKLEK